MTLLSGDLRLCERISDRRRIDVNFKPCAGEGHLQTTDIVCLSNARHEGVSSAAELRRSFRPLSMGGA
jgi:hypothetical protein